MHIHKRMYRYIHIHIDGMERLSASCPNLNLFTRLYPAHILKSPQYSDFSIAHLLGLTF